MDNNFIVIHSVLHRETPFKRSLTSVSHNHILCILVAVSSWSAVARGNSNLTREIYASSRLLVTQMMELEIIPITGAMLSWSRLINHESSWVENQQHFLCFIYQLQLVLSSAALLACRPGFLCRSVQLPKQGKKPKNRSKLWAPPASAMESRWRFLLTAAGCSQQSRRGNFSFGVIHHRAWEQEEEEDRGRTDRPSLTPDVWPLSNVSALAHSWLALEHTCEDTRHVHALRTVKLSWLTSGFLLYSSQQRGHMTRPFLVLSLRRTVKCNLYNIHI